MSPAHRRQRQVRHRPSRAVYRRRQLLSVASIITVLALVYLLLSSGASKPAATTTSSSRTTTTTTTAPTTTTTDPGLLPQTSTEPPSDDASLLVRFAPLFSAIQSDSQTLAQTVFFPESAYLQMKTGVLPNPTSDYQGRLVAFYNLDLAAYQRQLGAMPNSAQLTAMNADPNYATWIPPGTCENKIGYWHLPGVRMVYSLNGTVNSFAIASLISWRGVWYVVHLGPNPRPSNIGTVDQPATGPGVPGPPGGC